MNIEAARDRRRGLLAIARAALERRDLETLARALAELARDRSRVRATRWPGN